MGNDSIDAKRFDKQLENLKNSIPIGECRPIKMDVGGITTEVVACRNEKNVSIKGFDGQNHMRGKWSLMPIDNNGH